MRGKMYDLQEMWTMPDEPGMQKMQGMQTARDVKDAVWIGNVKDVKDAVWTGTARDAKMTGWTENAEGVESAGTEDATDVESVP